MSWRSCIHSIPIAKSKSLWDKITAEVTKIDEDNR